MKGQHDRDQYMCGDLLEESQGALFKHALKGVSGNIIVLAEGIGSELIGGHSAGRPSLPRC